jgi:hypothetical protein
MQPAALVTLKLQGFEPKLRGSFFFYFSIKRGDTSVFLSPER